MSENDNSKQQIYLGGSFEALNRIPFSGIRLDRTARTPNFKATISLFWANDDRVVSLAPSAQLILYPDYPEVRLSGFLRGCPTAPSESMKPISRRMRRGGPDGRVLILGLCPDGRIIAYLAVPYGPVARSLVDEGILQEPTMGVFHELPIEIARDPRTTIIDVLRPLVTGTWYSGRKLTRSGSIEPYSSPNAGGYTLEALLGVTPNGIPEPDVSGWEVKAFSGSRITLMTPEPDGGIYSSEGPGSFVLQFGHRRDDATFYFTGSHRVNKLHDVTKMTLRVPGFDAQTGRITEPDAGLTLETPEGLSAAIWSYGRLIEHWSRKHSRAVFVTFQRRESKGIVEFLFDPVVRIAEGTEFHLFLLAMLKGEIVYDPGIKLTERADGSSRTKNRNQFRTTMKSLPNLYRSFEIIDILKT